MSDLEKTIAIIFSGVDELSGPIKEITSQLDGFSSNIEAMAAPLSGAADNVLKLDTALVAFAAGGLVYAFNESKNFENSVVELEKVLGDGAGVDAAIEDAIRLSDIYGQSATEILLSTADFKQAGFDIEEAMTLTADSLDLVIAGNIDAAQSSDLIIAALKGFGLEADSARQYVDILNEVSNNYATDVEQLAAGLSTIAPIAEQMGFSMAESAGLITPVVEIFRSGEEAANALKTGLLRLVDDAKPVQDALAELGISQYDLNGEMRSGKDIFIDVATAFQTLDENQKLVITSQLTGIQQAGKMVTVFDNLALATEIAATAMDSAGSASTEVAARLESAEVSIDRFKVGFENLAVAVGDQFRMAAQEAIDGGTDIENALRGLIDDGTFDPFFDIINDFSGQLGELLRSIAENLPEAFEGIDFDGLLDAMGNVGDSIGGIFEDVDLSTPEGLREAIQNVVDSLTSLANITSGMIDAFDPFIQSLAGMITSFNNMDAGSQKSTGEILGLAKGVTEAGLEIALAVLAIGDAADDLAPIFEIVVNVISGSFDAVVVVWDGLKLAFYEILDDLLAASLLFSETAMFGAFSEDIEANRAVLAGWKDDVQKDMTTAADSAMEKLTGIKTNFLSLTTSATDSAKEIKKVPDELDRIPDEKRLAIEADTNKQSFDAAMLEMNKIPGEKETAVKAEADKRSIDSTKSAIEDAAPFTKKTTIDVGSKGVTEVKKDIADIPESKMMEIQLQGEIDKELARIQTEADLLQSAFEYEAKIDVAQIEADAKVAAAAFDAVAEAVAATADAASSMFDSLLSNIDDLDFVQEWKAWELVEEQMAMEQEALRLQGELTAAQVDYMRAKSEALTSGEGLIKIDSTGLEPALEMIMWEILEKIQVRVNEESAEFLLGL